MAAEVSSILSDLGVDVRTAAEVPAGSDVGSSLVEAVLSADFVCVVLSRRQPALAVMYEAGIAAGSRRPLVLVADEEAVGKLPFQFFSAPIIHYRPNSAKILRDSLRAYLMNVQPIAAQLTINWDTLVDEQYPALPPRAPDTEPTFIARIASRIAEGATYVTTEARVDNKTVDIIATFPPLGSTFNPVLFEVKRRPVRQESDIQQVLNYLRSAQARLGVLIYLQSARKPEAKAFGGLGVLIVSEADLMRWDDKDLIRELSRLRNQVVHSA